MILLTGTSNKQAHKLATLKHVVGAVIAKKKKKADTFGT